jgi:hypothetical protein
MFFLFIVFRKMFNTILYVKTVQFLAQLLRKASRMQGETARAVFYSPPISYIKNVHTDIQWWAQLQLLRY